MSFNKKILGERFHSHRSHVVLSGSVWDDPSQTPYGMFPNAVGDQLYPASSGVPGLVEHYPLQTAPVGGGGDPIPDLVTATGPDHGETIIEGPRYGSDNLGRWGWVSPLLYNVKRWEVSWNTVLSNHSFSGIETIDAGHFLDVDTRNGVEHRVATYEWQSLEDQFPEWTRCRMPSPVRFEDLKITTQSGEESYGGVVTISGLIPEYWRPNGAVNIYHADYPFEDSSFLVRTGDGAPYHAFKFINLNQHLDDVVGQMGTIWVGGDEGSESAETFWDGDAYRSWDFSEGVLVVQISAETILGVTESVVEYLVNDELQSTHTISDGDFTPQVLLTSAHVDCNIDTALTMTRIVPEGDEDRAVMSEVLPVCNLEVTANEYVGATPPTSASDRKNGNGVLISDEKDLEVSTRIKVAGKSILEETSVNPLADGDYLRLDGKKYYEPGEWKELN